MIPNFDLAKFNQQINAWLTAIAEAQQEPMGAEPRQLLEQAIAQVKRGQEMFNANYAKEAAAFKQEMEAVERMNAQTLAEAEAIKKQVSEFKIPEPPPPPVPPPIDPQLGFTLRQELLDRYTPKAVTPQPARPVIQDFSAEYSSDPSLSAEFPARVPPPSTSANPAELPDAVVAGLLQLAGVAARDVVYHLGCGDGRVLISAASRFHARGLGVDTQPAAVELARENIRKARLQSLVHVKSADPRQEECATASVVILSLGPQPNEAASLMLRRQLKPGARVVTADGPLKSWPADQSVDVTDTGGKAYRLHLWHIRAAAVGGSSIGSSGAEWDE